MMRLAALLLDLDGTLLDTAPDMGAALNALCLETGRAVLSHAQIRPWVSHGSVGLIQLAFPRVTDDESARLRSRFLELYAAGLAVHTRLFDGMAQVLEASEARGIPWGVVTNKPDWLTQPLLAELGLARRAACIVSGDTLAERKPHPRPLLHAAAIVGAHPAHCVYVGDAERDIVAGRAAGMRTVIAAYGYLGPGDCPGDWQADATIDDPGRLLQWLGEDPTRTRQSA